MFSLSLPLGTTTCQDNIKVLDCCKPTVDIVTITTPTRIYRFEHHDLVSFEPERGLSTIEHKQKMFRQPNCLTRLKRASVVSITM